MLVMLQYPVAMGDFTLQMHAGAAVVSVAMQGGKPQLWALSDRDAPVVEHSFVTIETGKELPEEIGDRLFVGTFLSPSEKLSFHLFDVGEEDEEEGEEDAASAG